MTPYESTVYCSASKATDERLRSCFERWVELIRVGLEGRVTAVVLAGSLGRGEGTVLASEIGPVLLSDVDLYVVGPSGSAVAADAVFQRLRAEVREDPFFAAPLDIAFVGPDYFAAMGNGLPAHQLALGSQVLYEAVEAAWVSPGQASAALRAVDPEDAHRLLLNRMAEATLIDGEIATPPFVVVHRAKELIDAPLAWLALRGEYEPGRREQLHRVDTIASGWPKTARARLVEGTALANSWLDLIANAPVDMESLEHWPSDDTSAPASERVAKVRDWVARFALASFGPPIPEFGDLRLAFESDDPVVALRSAGLNWLRRKPILSRWRQARRWRKLGPGSASPWWRHATGGSGEERVYVACALRYAGHADWRVPLEGLIDVAYVGEPEIDRWLGRLWADWLLGGGRR